MGAPYRTNSHRDRPCMWIAMILCSNVSLAWSAMQKLARGPNIFILQIVRAYLKARRHVADHSFRCRDLALRIAQGIFYPGSSYLDMHIANQTIGRLECRCEVSSQTPPRCPQKKN